MNCGGEGEGEGERGRGGRGIGRGVGMEGRGSGERGTYSEGEDRVKGREREGREGEGGGRRGRQTIHHKVVQEDLGNVCLIIVRRCFSFSDLFSLHPLVQSSSVCFRNGSDMNTLLSITAHFQYSDQHSVLHYQLCM